MREDQKEFPITPFRVKDHLDPTRKARPGWYLLEGLRSGRACAGWRMVLDHTLLGRQRMIRAGGSDNLNNFPVLSYNNFQNRRARNYGK